MIPRLSTEESANSPGPLDTRAWIESSNLQFWGSLILGVDKPSPKAQAIESLINLQALNRMSKCTVAKVSYKGGHDTKHRSIHYKLRNA